MKALFLDRDGVLNEVVMRDGNVHSPRSWDEVRHCEGLDELPEIKKLGFKLILVTNQPDVERGIVTEAFLAELHAYYVKRYALDAVYVCPFESNEHPMKKPNPGMFLKAASDHGLRLCDSFHLGDTIRDTVAAKRVGCASILWERPYNQGLEADFRISSLRELRKILIGE